MGFNSPFKGLNGLFRFAERRNLVSARVPSHFKRSLTAELQTTNVAYFQRKIKFCGFSAYPDGSPSQLLLISGVLLYFPSPVPVLRCGWPPSIAIRCRPLYGEQSGDKKTLSALCPTCCSILKLYFHTPYLCVLYDSYNHIYSYGIVC